MMEKETSQFKSIADLLESAGSKVMDFASVDRGKIIVDQEAMKEKLMETGITEDEAKQLVTSWRNHVIGMIKAKLPSN